jgi:hypothetical protein
MPSYARNVVTCIVLRMLTVVSGQVAAGKCTATFGAMKMCSVILNGDSTSGEPKLMALIDDRSYQFYKDSVTQGVIDNYGGLGCRVAYAHFYCVVFAGMLGAAPCDRNGSPMLPCYKLCTEYEMQCSPRVTNATATCVNMTAKEGATCLGPPAAPTISWVDIVFVVFAIVCEVLTAYGICVWTQRDDVGPDAEEMRGLVAAEKFMQVTNPTLAFFSFVASVVCSILKLYPSVGEYIEFDCWSPRCTKVVHNSVMTLATFFFSDIYDSYALHVKAGTEPVPTRINLRFKICQAMASIGYLTYDALQEKTPGPGSTVMVVLACLAELGVWCWESYTLYKTYYSVAISGPQDEGTATSEEGTATVVYHCSSAANGA